MPKTVIVLEDVVEKKFAMNNFPPPTYEESKICATKLAKFHAASFYLANEKVGFDAQYYQRQIYKTVF